MSSLYTIKTVKDNRISYNSLSLGEHESHQDQLIVYRLFDFSLVFPLNDYTPSSDLVSSRPNVDELRTIYSLPNSDSAGSSMYTVDTASHEIVFSTDSSDYLWKGEGVHHNRTNISGFDYDIQLPVVSEGETVRVIKKSAIAVVFHVFDATDELKAVHLNTCRIQITNLLNEALLERKFPALDIIVGQPGGRCPLDSDAIIPVENLNTFYMKGLRATGTVTFSAATSVTSPVSTIIITSTPNDTYPSGVSIAYKAEGEENVTDNGFDITTDAATAAASLTTCINDINGHLGLIQAENKGAGVVELTQLIGGSGGVTSISTTVTTCTVEGFAQTRPAFDSELQLQQLNDVSLGSYTYGETIDGWILERQSGVWLVNHPLNPIIDVGQVEATTWANTLRYNGTGLDAVSMVFNLLPDVEALTEEGTLPNKGQILQQNTAGDWGLSKEQEAIPAQASLQWKESYSKWYAGTLVTDTVPKIPGFLYGGTLTPFLKVGHVEQLKPWSPEWGQPYSPTGSSFPDCTGGEGGSDIEDCFVVSSEHTLIGDFGDVEFDVTYATDTTSPSATQLWVWDSSSAGVADCTVEDVNWTDPASTAHPQGVWRNTHTNLKDFSRSYALDGDGNTHPNGIVKIEQYNHEDLEDGDMLQWDEGDRMWKIRNLEEVLVNAFTNITEAGWDITENERAIIIGTSTEGEPENRPLRLDDCKFVKIETTGGSLPLDGTPLIYTRVPHDPDDPDDTTGSNGDNNYFYPLYYESVAGNPPPTGMTEITVEFKRRISEQEQLLSQYASETYWNEQLVETVRVERDFLLEYIALTPQHDHSSGTDGNFWGGNTNTGNAQTFDGSPHWLPEFADSGVVSGTQAKEGWKIYRVSGQDYINDAGDEFGDPASAITPQLISQARPGRWNDVFYTESNADHIISFDDIYFGWQKDEMWGEANENLTPRNDACSKVLLSSLLDDSPVAGGGMLYSPLSVKTIDSGNPVYTPITQLNQGDFLIFTYQEIMHNPPGNGWFNQAYYRPQSKRNQTITIGGTPA